MFSQEKYKRIYEAFKPTNTLKTLEDYYNNEIKILTEMIQPFHNNIITFGKYKDKSYRFVFSCYPSYSNFCIDKINSEFSIYAHNRKELENMEKSLTYHLNGNDS